MGKSSSLYILEPPIVQRRAAQWIYQQPQVHAVPGTAGEYAIRFIRQRKVRIEQALRLRVQTRAMEAASINCSDVRVISRSGNAFHIRIAAGADHANDACAGGIRPGLVILILVEQCIQRPAHFVAIKRRR